MSRPAVAVFTDTYLPTVNGVTYTVQAWRDRWVDRGGRMDVVYPDSDHVPGDGEYPVRSLPFPFYEGFRAGLPTVPPGATGVDVVHAHTPFSLGIGAVRLARREGVPLVAAYHTPTAEYADYVADGWLGAVVETAATTWERWYLNRVDVVVVPSDPARNRLRDGGVTANVEVVPNGVDTDFFTPDADAAAAFRDRHALPEERPLVGYTGRHGYEKQLPDLLYAADGLDVTVVFGGDGPARDDLEHLATTVDVDVRFLGFLDREDLPGFYASLDVFGFPSPVETQGLVALEAIACGTPVAGVDAGALSDTIDEGETGYTATAGDPEDFRATIERTLADRTELREACLARRADIGVETAVDRLERVYGGLLEDPPD
ncbi:MAG: glycosyltransferase [Haloarculaceae archaeon]